MKRIATLCALISGSFLTIQAHKESPGLTFTENKGQVSDQFFNPRPDVLFSGSAKGLVYHLRNNGISYQLSLVDSWKEEIDPRGSLKGKKIPDQTTIYRLDVNWLNCNTNAIIKRGETQGYNNYYLQSCPDGALNVKSYSDVTYENIYNGIDLKWYERDGQLKYDYLVCAGANYKNIQLEFKGATKISLNAKGELVLKTPLGTIIEQAPLVTQNAKVLPSKWIIKNNIISFDINNIDPNLPFVIDPALRIWGTYYGGNQSDVSFHCSTDASGNIYVSGYAASNTSTLIATIGSHQSINGGGTDAFLVKFNGAGVRQWATYYGGTGNDYGRSSSPDASGNVYMAGYTNSNIGSVIATPSSHQNTHAGGTWDAFVVKFNSAGVRQWGTYYGGTGTEYGNYCDTDASGNVYLTGYTSSNSGTVIATTGSHQIAHGGGTNDAYLVKFDGAGVRQWGTYYGGTGNDNSFSCKVDVFGNVFMSGYTASNTGTVIATAGSHQSAFGGGANDAFLVKFNGSGARQWGTYYGGAAAGSEYGYSCTSDASGNIYMTGETASNTGTVIATLGSHQSTFGGVTDAYLVKFDGNGLRLWGTYYGAAGSDLSNSCVTDATGNVYMGGLTTSTAAIATAGSHQTIFGGGTYDAFSVKFNSSGVQQWGTYYGGTGNDYGYSCSSDGSGNIYLTGETASTTGTVIATVSSHQSANGGGTNDAFLVKFSDCNVLAQPSAISGLASICFGPSQTYSVTNDPFATSYSWSLPGGWSGSSPTNTISATPGGTGIFTVTASNLCGTSPQQTLNVTVNALPSISVNSGSICNGQSFTINPNGANTYTFSSGPVVTPTTTSSYSVTGTSTAGCVSSSAAISNVTVNPLPTINVSTTNTMLCVGQSATLTASGASSYTFNPGGAGTSIVVSPTVTSTYTINGTDANGCTNSSSFTQSVSTCAGIDQISNSVSEIQVYPNPFNNKITIVSNFAKQPVLIYNALGSLIHETEIENEKIEIDLSKESSGIYFIRVGTVTQKIIKQ